MKAIILAAGIASRLRPLTDNTPKCLLKVGDKNLLQRTIDALLKNGIKEFVVVTGYLHQQIEDFISSTYKDCSFTYIHNEKFTATNNIYSLWMCKKAVQDQDVLLLDSDILFDSKIIAHLIGAKYPNALALNNHPLGEEEIKVVVDADGKMIEINKTCDPKSAIGESIGIEKMSVAYQTALFAELDKMILEEGLDNVFYEKAFERLIAQGHTFNIVDVTNLFSMELDTVEDFENAVNTIPCELA